MFTNPPQDFVDASWAEWHAVKQHGEAVSLSGGNIAAREQCMQTVLPSRSSSSSSTFKARPSFYDDAQASAPFPARKRHVADGVGFF